MAEREYTRLICVSCGDGFVPAVYNQITCSPECRLQHDRKRSFEYQRNKRNAILALPKPVKKKGVCEECGSVYVVLNCRHKTCSRKCLKAKHAKVRPSRAVLAQLLALETRQCLCCSAAFTPKTYQQRYCCSQCKMATKLAARTERYVGKRQANKKRVCGECGLEFVPRDERQITCSLKCSHKMYSRIGARIRRARMVGVYTEVFDPFDVFDRDGWRCQICGKPTPRAQRGTMRSNAPELDHRIPLSKGGAHARSNTQCACRACNMAKGNRSETGQLPMFG